MSKQNKLIQEQINYYKARANEYDEWFLRQGRYDHGPELNNRWFKEANEVKEALIAAKPKGSILELACGTGLWTQLLLPFASKITAVDSSTEMIELNINRLNNSRVRYHLVDIFAWKSEKKFDFVFFSFWLSHVPADKFKLFWDSVRSYLNPFGRIFFIDSLHAPSSSAKDHPYPEKSQMTSKRHLNDGREFEIVKIFYDADELKIKLSDLGWDMRIMKTQNYFLYGTGNLKQ